MNVVDSSCWLEWFAGQPHARAFREAIFDTAELLVPTIVLVEVHRRMLQQRGEQAALDASAFMKSGIVVVLDADLAVAAALVGQRQRLPLADSIIMATAEAYGATLWTMDAHFQKLPNVRYFKRPA